MPTTRCSDAMWCLRCHIYARSSFATPDMHALFGTLCVNHQGRARLKRATPGVLAQVVPQVRQL